MRLRILLADDHVMFRDGIRPLINREEGMEVVGEAEDGLETVRLAKELKPDIIIMDYRLPIKNGIDAAKEILEIDKKSKIIIVTADKNIRDEALTIGVTSFKEKPCPINLLKNNIIKALKA
ncbi:hypothetical protein LCGC14_0982220 [marine sediment metagenome]|uniref:Response regulatory domain-containing protein n=1 Tax=marine sediment metagenome TaxID=412755 RepID=A0A0F9N8F7_9ZZZZ